MIAYISNPDAFTDTMGIEESGNNISDVLDEAKYEWTNLDNVDGYQYEVTSKQNKFSELERFNSKVGVAGKTEETGSFVQKLVVGMEQRRKGIVPLIESRPMARYR